MNRNPASRRTADHAVLVGHASEIPSFCQNVNFFSLFALPITSSRASSMYPPCVILGSRSQSLFTPLKVWKLTSAVCLRLLLHGNREIFAPRSSASPLAYMSVFTLSGTPSSEFATSSPIPAFVMFPSLPFLVPLSPDLVNPNYR